MRRSIYRLSKVAEEGATGRSRVQRDAQDDEANERISSHTAVSSDGKRREKRVELSYETGALRAACRQALRVRRATVMTARQVSNKVRLQLRVRAAAAAAAR